MCELLGMSFKEPVCAAVSLDLFQVRGQKNPDGWGLAFYRDCLLQVIKEAKPAVGSSLYDFIEGYPRSETFISHVRRSTVGHRSYVNTHPFYRQLAIGSDMREFIFAHNGTLNDVSRLELGRFTPVGETDSERAFCALMETIAAEEISHWDRSSYRIMESRLNEINDGSNTLNCLFSDGTRLFCYSDENRYNDGLRFTEWSHPFTTMPLVQGDTHLGVLDVQSTNTESATGPSTSGYVIVTKALSEGDWTDFSPGQLMVFEGGSIVYS